MANYLDTIGRIVVVGLGSVGSYLLYELCNSIDKKIVGVDYDIVSENNISTSIYTKDLIGMQKTCAMRELLPHVETRLHLIDGTFPDNVDIFDDDVIIDCSDRYLMSYDYKRICKISSSGNIFHLYGGCTFKNLHNISSMYATRECIIKLVKEVTSLIKSGEIQKVFDGLSFTFISDHLVCKSELCIGKDIVVVKGTSNMSSYTGPVLISCSEEEIDQKLLSLCNKEVTIYTELSCEDGNTEIVKAGSSLDDMKELVLKRVYNNYVVYKIPYQLIVSDSQNKIIISTLESRA